MARKIEFSENQKELIITRYSQGEWPQTIAPDYNCGVDTILNNLKNWGIPIRKRIPSIELSNSQISIMLSLHAEGQSLDIIAKHINSTRVVVTRQLRKQGALIRRRGKAQKYFNLNGEKTCSTCGITKVSTDFSLHSSSYDGLQPTCRTCQNISHRNYYLKAKFGITEAEYNSILESQNGLCAICGQPETRKKFGKPTKLAVDHNHKTGAIRQLLCSRCNVVIGKIEENPILCDKIKDYLLKHNGLSMEAN
jgi:hypothetical protein